MHGPESLPYRPSDTLPAKPFGSTSRIIQPTDSRQSGPEFGPSPQSTGGARRGSAVEEEVNVLATTADQEFAAHANCE